MNKTILVAGMVVFAAAITADAFAQNRRSSSRNNNRNNNNYSAPGEQFSLEAALDEFKNASSPEDFERRLNSPNNNANNLDLDRDGETDYVRVLEKADGETHVFILEVPFTSSDNQDIAVIELERTSRDRAMVQIVGDEDLYGENNIVEPYEAAPNNNYYLNPAGNTGRGPNAFFETSAPAGIVVNVWGWPIVNRVYMPSYRVWVSPWGWGRRPMWYKPWRPAPVQVFYPRRSHYQPRYAVVRQHRTVAAHRFYTPMRCRSKVVVHYGRRR